MANRFSKICSNKKNHKIYLPGTSRSLSRPRPPRCPCDNAINVTNNFIFIFRKLQKSPDEKIQVFLYEKTAITKKL